MKTIICPNYLKGYYLNKLLAEQDIIFDIKLMPFEAFAYKYERIPQVRLLLQAKKVLDKLQLDIFAPMLKYPKFIAEVVDFTQNLILYHQDPQKLPETNPQERELKKIISAIYPLEHPQYQQRDIKLAVDGVETLDFFCNDLFTAKLKTSFDQIIAFSDLTCSKRYGRYALNARQEIESVAQDIVAKRSANQATIVLCDYANQFPLLKQIFQRYQIPFDALSDSQRPAVVLRFSKLVDLMLDNSLDKLKECLFHHCFVHDYPADLYAYYDTFIQDLTDLYQIPDLQDITIINKYDVDKIMAMAKRSQDYFLSIKEQLDRCLHIELSQILPTAYEIVQDAQDIASTNKIAKIINDALSEIQDHQDLAIVMEQIMMINADNAQYQPNSVIVTDLVHPVFANEDAYILGCTSKAFPNFPNYNGIFDEEYIAKLDILSLDQRYDLYMQQLTWIHKCAKNIYYSYYTNDYANKVFELALEIEELQLTYQKWPLTSNDIYLDEKPKLHDPSIFFKEGMLYGSVSAFERYFNCPYAYFIQYGLKLKQQFNFQIEANVIGTIMHAIMEDIIKIFGKQYPLHGTELTAISTPYFNQLTLLFPKAKLFIQALQKRMIQNLNIALEMLAKMESETSFAPAKTEFKFQQQYSNLPIMIKGTIDRIDTNHDYFRIIDYKSSTKKLQEKKIQAGLQLQLMTYLILGEQFLAMKPVGAYYYSLKNENIKVPAAKISRNVVSELTAEDHQKLYEDNKKLEGLTIFDPESCGLDHGHNIKSAKLDFAMVKECLDHIYQYLFAQLSSGNIAIAPTKDGCRYCQFQNICLNKKQGEDRIIYDKPLKATKGEAEDEI